MINKYYIRLPRPVRVIFFILLILIAGCEPEEHTLPVDFDLIFKIAETPVMEGKLVVQSIALNLGSIEIEGRRTVGEDVFMTRKFDDTKFVILRPHFNNEVIRINIPQGVYNRLSLQLMFKPDPQEEDLYDDFEEWLEDMQNGEDDIDDLREDLGDIIEDFLDDVSPCIIMHAKYYIGHEQYHVIFVINDPLSLNILALNAFGDNEISLDRNTTNRGEIVFDPSVWFSVVTAPMLESAFYGLIDDEKYIFLHKKVNPLLFATIFNRLNGSVALHINL